MTVALCQRSIRVTLFCDADGTVLRRSTERQTLEDEKNGFETCVRGVGGLGMFKTLLVLSLLSPESARSTLLPSSFQVPCFLSQYISS